MKEDQIIISFIYLLGIYTCLSMLLSSKSFRTDELGCQSCDDQYNDCTTGCVQDENACEIGASPGACMNAYWNCVGQCNGQRNSCTC